MFWGALFIGILIGFALGIVVSGLLEAGKETWE